jgi:hypothetical protein
LESAVIPVGDANETLAAVIAEIEAKKAARQKVTLVGNYTYFEWMKASMIKSDHFLRLYMQQPNPLLEALTFKASP